LYSDELYRMSGEGGESKRESEGEGRGEGEEWEGESTPAAGSSPQPEVWWCGAIAPGEVGAVAPAPGALLLATNAVHPSPHPRGEGRGWVPGTTRVFISAEGDGHR